MQAKVPIKRKKRKSICSLVPIQQGTLTDISQAEGNQTSLCKKSYMEFLELLQSKMPDLALKMHQGISRENQVNQPFN